MCKYYATTLEAKLPLLGTTKQYFIIILTSGITNDLVNKFTELPLNFICKPRNVNKDEKSNIYRSVRKNRRSTNRPSDPPSNTELFFSRR